jgi:hypothetical protein
VSYVASKGRLREVVVYQFSLYEAPDTECHLFAVSGESRKTPVRSSAKSAANLMSAERNDKSAIPYLLPEQPVLFISCNVL